MAKKLPVIELFGPTLQGEGALAGSSSHFLRLGGCPRRCVQCDSLHAVLPKLIKKNAEYLDPAEIGQRLVDMQQMQIKRAEWLTFSGGDPVMWPNVAEIIHCVRNRTSLKMAVETQGDLWQDWLLELDHITVSPKAPGMDPVMPVILQRLDKYVDAFANRMCFKTVVFTQEDLELVQLLLQNYGDHGIPMYISVGTDIRAFESNAYESFWHEMADLRTDILDRMDSIFDWVCEKGIQDRVRILPQTHVLLWGTKQGV